MDAEDFMLDADGDLLIENDDYVIGLSDEQHIEDILDGYPGEYRNAPMLGVYLQRAVNGLVDGSIRRDIAINLEADNYKVGSVTISGDNLDIDAKRKS